MKYGSEMFNCDSIMLNIHQQEQPNPLKTLPIEIIANEKKEVRKHKESNEEFYKIITLRADNINDYLKINDDIINSTKELVSIAKRIEIITEKSANTDKLVKDIKSNFKTSLPLNTTDKNANKELIILKIYI
jgi:hypothetical protein